MKQKLLYTLLFAAMLITRPITAETIHVYSTEIPWQKVTIEKDDSKVYSINTAISQATLGDSIVIHEGIYREKVTLTKDNLILASYKEDYVLVTGTEVVTGWTQSSEHANGIYEASISGFNIETSYTQLFANGENQMMARHPNNTIGKMMEVLSDNSGYALLSNVYKDAGVGAEAHATMEGDALPDVDLTGGIFRAMTGKMRNYVYGNITSNAGNTVNFTAINNGVWKNEAAIANTYHKFSWGYALHQNLIDIPGEWFAADEKVYFMPESDKDINSMRVEIQVRERVLVINNRSNITIKGIHFLAGNVDMQNTSGTTIQACSMRYLYPFWTPNGYGQGDTDKKGVYLSNSSNNNFTDNYIAHSWGNMIAVHDGENNTFENCKITDFGWVGVFTSGIHISESNNTNISKCTFGDAGRFQVRIDGGDAKVNILDCDFYGSMKMGEDAGPIEATSTGRIGSIDLKGSIIAYNKIHDVSGVPVSDGNYKRVKATAFYMEDVENYTAHHNLIYNIKHEGYDGPHEIEKVGEFLYLGPRYNPMYKPVNYYNNTIWNVDENIGIWNIRIDNWEELGLTSPDTSGCITDGHFANNIFMNGPSYKLNYSSQVLTSTGGKVSWAESPEGSSISTENFTTYTNHCANWNYHFNPENNQFYNFADASSNFIDAATGDFTLVDGSTSKGAGVELSGFTSSSNPDCGALEGGNRVLMAGSTLESIDFKEEGTNYIPETEWIKYVDFPAEFIDTTTLFNFKVAYNAFEERDIVISFRDPSDTYLFQGRTTVASGQDTAVVTVKATSPQPIANAYIFLAALRPKGGKWNENLYSQTLNSDIVATYTAIQDLTNNAFKVYPNPAKHTLTIERNSKLNTNSLIEIYSISGSLVYSELVKEQGLNTININMLKKGMYMLKIDQSNSQIFIKQ